MIETEIIEAKGSYIGRLSRADPVCNWTLSCMNIVRRFLINQVRRVPHPVITSDMWVTQRLSAYLLRKRAVNDFLSHVSFLSVQLVIPAFY